ncbi:hypothetical protein FQN60_017249, partial [Etheostoma spectabile]
VCVCVCVYFLLKRLPVVCDPASVQKSRKTVVRMKIQSSANMEDPAHSVKLLQQLRSALANQGVTDVNLTWKKQPVKQAKECNDSKDAC